MSHIEINNASRAILSLPSIYRIQGIEQKGISAQARFDRYKLLLQNQYT